MTTPHPEDRPLCSLEKSFWKFDLAVPMNAVMAARVEGPLHAELLRQGLTALQDRHAYLRCAVVQDADGMPHFRFGAEEPCPLRVVQGDPEVVQAEMEREMNQRFLPGQAPLMRATLIEHGSQDHTVMLTAHHAVVDSGGMVVMRDLLESCSQVLDGGSPALPVVEDMRSVESRIPLRLRGWKGLEFMQRVLSTELGLFAHHGPRFKMTRSGEAPFSARTVRMVRRELDAEATARLLARARAERTTLQGALTAALLLAVLQEAKVTGSTQVMAGHAVDMRKLLEPPVVDGALGFYVGVVPFRGAVSPHDHFWDLARSVREQLADRLARGEHFMLLDLYEHVFRLLRGNRVPPLEIAARWEKAGLPALHLTTVGRLERIFGAGPLRVRGLQACAAPSMLTELTAVGTTFDGVLAWTYVYCEPLLTATRVRHILDLGFDQLAAAVG